MALPPRRPYNGCRRHHAKTPVTAPSHKPTSSYDLPAGQVSENLDRIAALERKVELDTVNRRVEPEQLADKLDGENQRGPKTVTAKDDRFTRKSKECEILQATYLKQEHEFELNQAKIEKAPELFKESQATINCQIANMGLFLGRHELEQKQREERTKK